jgi:S-adenosylmethionine:tRNA ribosyltransferase-isomerase
VSDAATDPLAEWDFELPPDLVARRPLAERDASRLLVVGETLEDRTLRELPALLQAGDLLVLNDVRVRHARLPARRATGGKVEILVLRADADHAEVMLRPARKLRPGELLEVGPGRAVVEALLGEGRARLRFDPSLALVEAAVGQVPLPPYLGREAEPEDAERYQTVYARAGPLAAAAAPTAGLHFSVALLAAIAARGVRTATLALEVGLGTFRPLTPEVLARGRLHAERFVVPESTWAAVEDTRLRGGRVVAVGTTAVRTLESATGPGPGETDCFLRPGWRPRRVDALFTNFHLPRSSLLMLVAAFGGTERVREAYAHAVARRYRFFSYGDACFFPRPLA